MRVQCLAVFSMALGLALLTPASAQVEGEAESFESLGARAEQGDADAQYKLGYAYVFGQDVRQNLREALKWFRMAAEQGYPDAQYALGVVYDEGKGVLQDYREALKWFRMAAEQGYPDAQYALGVVYANGQGVPQDLLYYDRAVVGGIGINNRAVARAGGINDRAVAGGDGVAAYYSSGQGVSRDYGEAVKWFRMAAEQGHSEAQFALGLMYQRGQGVSRDRIQAHIWFNLAAMKGNADAVKQRDSLAVRMTSEQIAEAHRLAAEWKPKPPSTR